MSKRVGKNIYGVIPRVTSPQMWEFVIQKHDAKRRGTHLDIRLAPPGWNVGFSWATTGKEARLPKPGERINVIQTELHDLDYFDFEGRLGPGYGEGNVTIVYRGKVEVTDANENKISFNIYYPTKVEEYALIRIQDVNWILLNKTRTLKHVPIDKLEKGDYKLVPITDVKKLLEKENVTVQPKLDGAFSFVYLEKDKPVRVFSHRLSKRHPEIGVIEYTHKIEPLLQTKVPSELHDTILKAEVLAVTKDNKPLPAHELGGILNSNVLKAREDLKNKKAMLKVFIFDVVKYKGKDVSHLPYEERYKLLQEIKNYIASPALAVVPMLSPKEAPRVLELMKRGKFNITNEGLIIRTDGKTFKAKIRPDYDVYVRDFFPGEGKYKNWGVGGFYYSHTPDGPIVGKVGTGLSDELRRDMYLNPKKYIGRVAVVEAMGIYDKTGALRAPSFVRWHLDKNPPEFLATAKL